MGSFGGRSDRVSEYSDSAMRDTNILSVLIAIRCCKWKQGALRGPTLAAARHYRQSDRIEKENNLVTNP